MKHIIKINIELADDENKKDILQAAVRYENGDMEFFQEDLGSYIYGDIPQDVLFHAQGKLLNRIRLITCGPFKEEEYNEISV